MNIFDVTVSSFNGYKSEVVSKCWHNLFLCAKPRLSQARALLLPKVYVTLGITFSLWQSYIFVLTFPTKPFFFHKELFKRQKNNHFQ